MFVYTNVINIFLSFGRLANMYFLQHNVLLTRLQWDIQDMESEINNAYTELRQLVCDSVCIFQTINKIYISDA